MACNDSDNRGNNNCSFGSFEKNRYFYGKLMTVRDFNLEQDYHIGKRNLLNRLVEGVGIVRGLKVNVEKVNQADKVVTINISKGAAIDCCGREIVVPDDVASKDVKMESALSDGKKYYVYLKYAECTAEKVPAVTGPSSACEEVCCENRIRESWHVEIVEAGAEEPDRHPMKWTKLKEFSDKVSSISDDDIKNLAKLIAVAKEGNAVVVNDVARAEAKKLLTIDELLGFLKCDPCDDPKVLIAVLSKVGGQWKVDKAETLKSRSVVFSNPVLYELIDSHITNFENPHNVTASQLGSLKSVNNVAGYVNGAGDGNVDLVGDGGVVITPVEANKQIKINAGTVCRSINNVEPDNDGKFNIEAGANITVEGVANGVKISAQGGGVGKTYHTEDFNLINGYANKVKIKHNLGEYPVVDIYYRWWTLMVGTKEEERNGMWPDMQFPGYGISSQARKLGDLLGTETPKTSRELKAFFKRNVIDLRFTHDTWLSYIPSLLKKDTTLLSEEMLWTLRHCTILFDGKMKSMLLGMPWENWDGMQHDVGPDEGLVDENTTNIEQLVSKLKFREQMTITEFIDALLRRGFKILFSKNTYLQKNTLFDVNQADGIRTIFDRLIILFEMAYQKTPQNPDVLVTHIDKNTTVISSHVFGTYLPLKVICTV